MPKQTRKEKHLRRLQRLVARLTLLNAEVPTTEYGHKMLAQERANIIRQLQKYNIRMEPA